MAVREDAGSLQDESVGTAGFEVLSGDRQKQCLCLMQLESLKWKKKRSYLQLWSVPSVPSLEIYWESNISGLEDSCICDKSPVKSGFMCPE